MSRSLRRMRPTAWSRMHTDVSGPSDPADGSNLLAVLQFSDSFFPSGATAFSWGLESFCEDALIGGPGQIAEVLEALLLGRWAGFDRPLMLAAHGACAATGVCWMSDVAALDSLCEAMTLSDGIRSASRRLGTTQLKVHSALGLAEAMAYQDHISSDPSKGHLPIAQGLIGRGLGLSLDECEAMAAFGQCVSVVGAAIRLGVIGHLDGQRLLSKCRSLITATQATEPPALDDLWNAAPGMEIAAMRHEPRRARMFAS
ncbi:MAG: urease accessory UreF family protein [Burkholderiales bacterium]